MSSILLALILMIKLSTLSLHIAAYEKNSGDSNGFIEAEIDEQKNANFQMLNDLKKCFVDGEVDGESYVFEFPRQQKEQESASMQASQKISDPSQVSPGSPNAIRGSSIVASGATKMFCGICCEEYSSGEFQQLACGHTFCMTCIPMCGTTVLCPHLLCPAIRSMDIVVDEADSAFDADLDDQDGDNDITEKHQNRIAFAARLPMVMRLEEKQRCEGHKGPFQCFNSARITFTACRHSTCFDCFGKRLQAIAKFNDPILCPTARCSNRLTKTEIKRLAERPGSKFSEICDKIMASMRDDIPREDRPTGKDEVRVYCSIHGSDTSTKLMYIPFVCTFGDMVNAFMQVLRIDKTFVASELHIYVRTITETGKSKFEQLNLKQISRKSIRDSVIADKTHVVFDLKNEVGKL